MLSFLFFFFPFTQHCHSNGWRSFAHWVRHPLIFFLSSFWKRKGCRESGRTTEMLCYAVVWWVCFQGRAERPLLPSDGFYRKQAVKIWRWAAPAVFFFLFFLFHRNVIAKPWKQTNTSSFMASLGDGVQVWQSAVQPFMLASDVKKKKIKKKKALSTITLQVLGFMIIRPSVNCAM